MQAVQIAGGIILAQFLLSGITFGISRAKNAKTPAGNLAGVFMATLFVAGCYGVFIASVAR